MKTVFAIAVVWALLFAQISIAEPVFKIESEETFFAVRVEGEGATDLIEFSFYISTETDDVGDGRVKKIQLIPAKEVEAELQKSSIAGCVIVKGTVESFPTDNILLKFRLLDAVEKSIDALSSDFKQVALLRVFDGEKIASWTKSEYPGRSDETLLRFEKNILLAFEFERKHVGEYVADENGERVRVGALDQWMLWNITEIESSFREDVVVQENSKCLGSLQIQPKWFAKYSKPERPYYYDPFDILDSIRIAIRVLQDPDNAAATRAELDRKLAMYNTGEPGLDSDSAKSYLAEFAKNESLAKKRMERATEMFADEVAQIAANWPAPAPEPIVKEPKEITRVEPEEAKFQETKAPETAEKAGQPRVQSKAYINGLVTEKLKEIDALKEELKSFKLEQDGFKEAIRALEAKIEGFVFASAEAKQREQEEQGSVEADTEISAESEPIETAETTGERKLPFGRIKIFRLGND